MALEDYQQKRDFKKTTEPPPKLSKIKSKKHQFVVHKHLAQQLHYDLRLESGGVLKSWAIPKGPSLNPQDRHLAIKVEDHPFEYRKFEGVIPKGEYGAGSVIIWDRGWYEMRKSKTHPKPKTLEEAIKLGHATFILHGKKLRGEFALIKNKHLGQDNWLLIKKGDQYAATEDITRQDKSVISGKTVEQIVGKTIKKRDLEQTPKKALLRNVRPMLTTLIEKPFTAKDWLFEIKWDGFRAIASWDKKDLELYSRNGLDFTKKFPVIAETIRNLKHRVVLDGEIVVLDKNGKPHFEWLQNWNIKPKGRLVYYVFDLLWFDGHNLQNWPLIKRKELLADILPKSLLIHYSDHIVQDGEQFFKTAQKNNLEGIVAKKINSFYKQGLRTKDWLKIKSTRRQEVVIGGFTEPRGSRKDIGALIVGVYEKNKLVYVAHVGGGLDTDQLTDLRKKLDRLILKKSPFSNKFKTNEEVHWTSPKLVCEVKFAEWTSEGNMRQPIFIGLREDKKPKQIKRELPKKVKY